MSNPKQTYTISNGTLISDPIKGAITLNKVQLKDSIGNSYVLASTGLTPCTKSDCSDIDTTQTTWTMNTSKQVPPSSQATNKKKPTTPTSQVAAVVPGSG